MEPKNSQGKDYASRRIWTATASAIAGAAMYALMDRMGAGNPEADKAIEDLQRRVGRLERARGGTREFPA